MIPANEKTTGFFSNALQNRNALIPGAAHLLGYANQGQLGKGSAVQYNSRVSASQMNGSGPAIPPVAAPFSFTQFATGVRAIVKRRGFGK